LKNKIKKALKAKTLWYFFSISCKKHKKTSKKTGFFTLYLDNYFLILTLLFFHMKSHPKRSNSGRFLNVCSGIRWGFESMTVKIAGDQVL